MQLTRRYTSVIAYIRVSGEGQFRDGTSPEAQEAAHRRFCQSHGLPEPLIFIEVESATGAKTEARVVQARVQQQAQPGTLVIVTVVDRWSRDILHGVSTIRDLVARGVGFVAHFEEIDASTPHGAEALAQKVLDAQKEHRRIKDRTVGARQALTAQGIYCEGEVPFGYRREVQKENGRKIKRLVVEPIEAEARRLAFELAASGHSAQSIATRLPYVRPGRKRWDGPAVQRLLDDRIVLGEVRTAGKGKAATWIQGQHEAIVTRDLWERAHAGIASRRNAGRVPTEEARTASWLLRGAAVCGVCGSKMIAAYAQSRGGSDYYACRARVAWRIPGKSSACTARYVRVDGADAEVERLALERILELRYELAQARPVAAPAAPARDFEGERTALKARRSRIADMFEHGRIEAADFDRRVATVEEELGRLELAAAAADRAARAAEVAQSPERRAKLSDGLEALRAAWAGMPRAAQRDVVKILAAAIHLAHAEVRVTWRTVEELLEERVGSPGR